MARCHGNRCSALAAGILITVCTAPAWGQADPPAPGLAPVAEPSPLLHEPKTPEEMFDATVLTVGLARIDLASRYLQQFLDANPDDATLIALRDKYGTGEFLKLSRIPELKAKAQGLLDRLGAASRKQAESPAYAEELIAKLGGDRVQRELAIRELRHLGALAVPHLLRKLAESPSAEQTDQIVHALGRMGRAALPPLVAGLEAPKPEIRFAVLNALALIQSKEAVPYLWHPAFEDTEPVEIQQTARQALARILTGTSKVPASLSLDLAAKELKRITRGYYFHEFDLPLNDDGVFDLWAWDREANTVVHRAVPAAQAELLLATRFASQSHDLSPENPEAQRMALGSLLAENLTTIGRNRPLPLDPGSPGYAALTAGEDVVSQVLADALAAGQPAAAQAALQVLGQIGSHQQIIGGGRKSPVLSALNYPDLRVQFAAANTVLRMEPGQSFPGADRVVSILVRAITEADETKALIIDADRSRAELTAGFLSELGYRPVMTRTGKEGFKTAATTSGIDFAVIDINCIEWTLSQTVANFRADARTAYLPLVFYGPEDITDVRTRSGRRNTAAFPEASSSIWNGTLPPGGREDRIQGTTRAKLSRMIRRSGPATFIAESGLASDFIHQLRPFLESVKGSPLTAEERGDYQSIAARWLAHLAQTEKSDVFDLTSAEAALSKLVDNPDLAQTALVALSGIPSPAVQSQLVTVVVNPQDAPALRVGAAHQLAYHIQQHGVLLPEDTVRELSQAWRTAEDPTVATALAVVMGSLHPDSKTVRERLEKLPAAQ